MSGNAAESLKNRLRTDLRAAMVGKRKAEISLLRALLAAIDNAEAPAQSAEQVKAGMRSFGEGTAEVGRLTLMPEQLAALLAREIASRELAAAEMASHGQTDRAQLLRDEAALAKRYLR
jgi:hypothetical protein